MAAHLRHVVDLLGDRARAELHAFEQFNFRLVAEEVRYIVGHSGARILMVDPELDAALADVQCEHRFTIGVDSDAPAEHAKPRPWVYDEDATATINYTSGTTARPKGVQLTHRNIWLNATTFGWQLGVNDRAAAEKPWPRISTTEFFPSF